MERLDVANMTIRDEILSEIDKMTPDRQMQVLEYVRDLTANAPPKGTLGKDLLQFAGILTAEEADAVLKAVEEGCEQVYPSEWTSTNEW